MNRYTCLKKYGITKEQYEAKLDNQPTCAICGTHHNDLKKGLCLDHNHETEQIREFLCNRCNMVVGLLETCPEVVELANNYLHKHA